MKYMLPIGNILILKIIISCLFGLTSVILGIKILYIDIKYNKHPANKAAWHGENRPYRLVEVVLMLYWGEDTEGHNMISHLVMAVLSRIKFLLSTSFVNTPSILFFVLITFLFITPAFADSTSQTRPQITSIRIGITPVILDQQLQFLRDWQSYLETHLQRPVEFIQRDSYAKITRLLLKGELDFGWICGYPYVQHQSIMELIAIPLYKGKPLYQSYLIVSNTDTETSSLLNLQDTVFAFSDPDSNSGYLYAQFILTKAGKNPELYFKRSFFTRQHKNTIEAVATGLAQAGIVDGYIWDTMEKQNDPLIPKTRVANKSSTFAFPPIVATNNVSSDIKHALQDVLLAMNNNSQGKRLLEYLNIDGFISGGSQLYDGILNMHLFIENGKHDAS